MSSDDAQMTDVLAVETIARAMREAIQPRGAAVYETFTLTITRNGQPTPLLGYDLTRTRALVMASENNVYIGKRSQLSGARGFILSQTAAVELFTTDEIFVAFIDESGAASATVDVSVYMEKALN